MNPAQLDEAVHPYQEQTVNVFFCFALSSKVPINYTKYKSCDWSKISDLPKQNILIN